MSKKYIKNCTGDDCDIESRAPGLFSVVIFYFLLACFVGVSAYILLFSQYLQVTKVSIEGVSELDAQELQADVENSLQGKFLGILPKNNFILVSQNKIKKLLANNYKKISSVTVVKKFPDTINVKIEEHKALLVWCVSDKCYLLDENGVAYGNADFNSPELVQNNLLQISDRSGKEATIGNKIIEPSYAQYALRIKDALSALGLEVTEQYYTPSRMAEEINIKTNQDLEIYFSTQFPLESAIKTLATVVNKEIMEDKKNDVSYIDLRNENKAFYKFKNVELPIVENQEIEKEEQKQ